MFVAIYLKVDIKTGFIMLSVIICSISPKLLSAAKENLISTVGDTELEIIAVDNRERKWPIAKAYNYGASQAKYPNLFFMHEDVLFFTKDWGAVMERKLAEPDCGVIGFAGSCVKLKSYSSSWQRREWEHSFACRRIGGMWIGFDVEYHLRHPFQETLTVDGLGIFVRKEVWKENPFDEVLLTGFHCYDVDFSMQIAHKYKNYVCCSPAVMIKHYSEGNYNAQWYYDTIRMHKSKWNRFLPMVAGNVSIEKSDLRKYDEHAFNCFVYGALRSKEFSDKNQLMIEFWKYRFTFKHLINCLVNSLKYIRICMQK